ncbi:MAG: hypothetical protein IID63_05020 [candidate division Zixibacteria bacterium]|nr:hypothetical protein [candidate division Zixibacteria bacterium]
MNRLARFVFYLIILFMLMLQSESFAQNSVKVGRSVIAGGGSKSTTSIYRSSGTIGQASTGRATTTIYKLGSGFWSGPFSGSCCIGTTGDLNGDGRPNTALDLVFIIDKIFRGGSDPICPFEGDLDGDGIVLSMNDLLFMIDFIFRGGDSPVACP